MEARQMLNGFCHLTLWYPACQSMVRARNDRRRAAAEKAIKEATPSDSFETDGNKRFSST